MPDLLAKKQHRYPPSSTSISMCSVSRRKKTLQLKNSLELGAHRKSSQDADCVLLGNKKNDFYVEELWIPRLGIVIFMSIHMLQNDKVGFCEIRQTCWVILHIPSFGILYSRSCMTGESHVFIVFINDPRYSETMFSLRAHPSRRVREQNHQCANMQCLIETSVANLVMTYPSCESCVGQEKISAYV